ncbi:MAG: putative peptidoglycan glycosyltransferase FtsW [Pseudomonadota bacterium]
MASGKPLSDVGTSSPASDSNRLTRADRSPLGDWWWTIDKVSLLTMLLLLTIGIVMSFAASPPIARDLNLSNEFHFVHKHLVFLIPTLGLMVALSMMDKQLIVRLSLLLFFGAIGGMLLAIAFGAEIKGSRRWVDLGFFQMQPSEFVKPALVVVCAWLFAEHAKRPDLKANLMAAGLFVLTGAILIAQPDIGQTVLVTGVWGLLFFVAGMSWVWIGVLGSLALSGIGAAYVFIPHVASRIDRFLNPESGDNHQTDRAIDSFVEGGLFGRGPGEGVVKEHLPDSHTDFLFAVIAEEFGILVCLMIVALYLFVFLRAVRCALTVEDLFSRFTIVGLVGLLAMQATINMGVNLQLLPAKGMTLPFLSYGGSSLFSVGITSGILLALTRRTPATRTGQPSTGHTLSPWRWSMQGRSS